MFIKNTKIWGKKTQRENKNHERKSEKQQERKKGKIGK